MSKQAVRSGGSISFLRTAWIGWMVLAILQIVLGFVLGMSYKASLGDAHSTTEQLHSKLGFLQGFHYWGSAMMIAFGALVAVLAVFFRLRGAAYFACLLPIAVSLGFQITGNILPFDLHGAQTATIEIGILAKLPLLGEPLANLLAGGKGPSGNTLSQWYMFHRILLPVGVLLTLGLGWKWASGEKNFLRAALVWIPSIVVLVLGIGVPSPLGTAASADDFGQFGAMVSWYTLPLHGLLTAFSKMNPSLGWVGAILIPGLLATGFIAIGFSKPKHWWPPVYAIAVIGFLGWIAFAFGGKPAPLTGKRDPQDQPLSQVPPTRVAGKNPDGKDPEGKKTLGDSKVTEPTKEPAPKADVQDAALAKKGALAFADRGCVDCHGTDLKGTSGGPNITQIHKRHSDADYFMRFIKKPTSVKPASMMPAYEDMAEGDLRALAEYLRFPKP